MKIDIFGPIGTGPGEISAPQIRHLLDEAAGEPVEFRIHSEGGSVFEAIAIHDAIKKYEGETVASVESMALSAGSLIVMAADERKISENGYMMVHGVHYGEEGEELSDDEKRLMQQLDKTMVDIYSNGTGLTRGEVEQMISKDTFIDAKEAQRLGFVDVVAKASPVAVSRAAGSDMYRKAVASAKRPGESPSLKYKRVLQAKIDSGVPRAQAALAMVQEYPELREEMIDEANMNAAERKRMQRALRS
jgi:ATP-dependent protease ClpP protease subunit